MADKKIIDVCCGGRMFWFNKNNPDVEFCDIRQEQMTLCDGRDFFVSPETVCDFTKLPHKDNSFYMVVFDPPHLIKVGENSWLTKKYGKLPKDYISLLTKGFSECLRVLKTNGTLIFKWNESDNKVSEILKCTPAKPLFGHKSGKLQNTHWIVFMKTGKKG